jgi:REP element-mobilizing transposase RayT
MTRPLRIQFEGATYHVFSKGNMGEIIFRDNHDKGTFLIWLGKGAEKYQVDIYAYCIMENHYHLLIQTQKSNLSEFMHFLLSSYASYISMKGWEGHVFARRYSALLVEEEAYLLVVSRYVHLNPVAAGIVKIPEDYYWSSYSSYCNFEETPSWLKKEWINEYFGPGYKSPELDYREFVEEGIKKPLEYPEDNIHAQAILGSREFAEKAIMKAGRGLKNNDVVKNKLFMKELSLNGIYRMVCDYYQLESLEAANFNDSSNYRKARKALIYLAREYTTLSNREISDVIGGISHSTVSSSYIRTKRLLEKDEHNKEQFKEEIHSILRNAGAWPQ